MNLVLFEPGEIQQPLPVGDPRARHILSVLRRRPGDAFDCGVIDGPRGRATVTGLDSSSLFLDFAWDAVPPPLDPIWLLVGLPRPQTARKVLSDATALGVARLCFFETEKGEGSYRDSRLWTTDEVRRHLIAGAAQAFCTRLPEVRLVPTLDDAIERAAGAATRLALDNYEATCALSRAPAHALPAALAVGPERGWSARERDTLRDGSYTIVHAGSRVLRTETACIAGLALLKDRLGLL